MKILIFYITIIHLILFADVFAEMNKSGVSPNVISLPSGPGSIEGLGESFEPHLNSGTSTYRIPLNIPPGKNNCSPDLVLTYNSGYGNSFIGSGWKIDIPFIQRQTDKGQPLYSLWPDIDGNDNNNNGQIDEYDEFDSIIYSNGEELIPTTNGYWRFENESEFTRFERYSKGWLAKQKDGKILRFGTNIYSRIQDKNGRIFKWHIDEIIDTNGNKITFSWEKKDDTCQLYCSTIKYNIYNSSNISINFHYEKRPDIIVDFRPGYELKTSFRCKTIKIFERNNHVRTYQLDYKVITNELTLSLLSCVTQVGSDNISKLPPAKFEYVPFLGKSTKVKINTLSPNINLVDENIELIDLNADGLPDILNTNQNPHYYYLNLGTNPDGDIRWTTIKRMSLNILKYLSSDTVKLADIDGDGQTELLSLQGNTVRFYNVDSSINWKLKNNIISSSRLTFSPSVRIFDANNDKRIDIMQTTSSNHFVWINQKNNTWSKRFTKNSTDLRLQFDRNTTKLADMNGDRIPDLVHLERGICFYYPGKGYGDYSQRIKMKNPPDKINDETRFILADINGDGLNDLIHAGNNIIVWINKGIDPENHNYGRFAAPFTIITNSLNYSKSFRQADINGNGSIDIVWNTDRNNIAFIDFTEDEQPYQIKKITNGIGLSTKIYYRSSVVDMASDRDSGNQWAEKLPFPIQVVSKIEVNDGLNSYTTTFSYHDGYYDGEEKEFRGFARVEKVEIGDNTAPDLVVEYNFDTGVKHNSLKGKLLGIKFKTRQNEIFYHEENYWNVREITESINEDLRTITFPYKHKRTRYILEKGVGTPVQIAWDYEYDNFGNTIRLFEYGRLDSGWDDERITEISYSSQYPFGKLNWILNKKIEIRVSDENGKLSAHKIHYYDDSITPGYITKGNLTRVEEWIEGNSYIISVRNKYDQDGNIVAIYDPLYKKKQGHFREIKYDSVYNTYPVKEIIYTGNEKIPQLTLSATYNFGFGTISTSTDFNGFTTYYDYDCFSRLISVTKPPDTNNTMEYDYVLNNTIDSNQTVNWIETRIRDGSSGNGFFCSRDYFNGFANKIMTRSEGEVAGQIVVKDAILNNSRGFACKKYFPYFETGTLDYKKPDSNNNKYSEHLYDSLGRELKIYQPEEEGKKLYSSISYEPLKKNVQDQEQTNSSSLHFGCKIKYVEDGLLDKDDKGRLRQVYEIVKLSDNGESLSTPVKWMTSYLYDLQNNLIRITDSQNNQKHIVYDGIGRKVFMNDPDRGHLHYKYDNASNLIKKIDAKGQVTGYEYDGINRLIAEYYNENSSLPDVEYHYDLPYGSLSKGKFWKPDLSDLIKQSILNNEKYFSEYDLNHDFVVDVSDLVKVFKASQINISNGTVKATNTLGLLAWVKDQSGEEHISYDSRSRIIWYIKRIVDDDNKNIKLTNFYTQMEYDSMDRVNKRVYPDGSVINYLFNSRGILESIPGIIDLTDYNPKGQNKFLKLSCGTVISYEYDNRFRLKKIKTERVNDNLVLQNLLYTYDGVSNIISINDLRSENDFKKIASDLGLNTKEKYKFNSSQKFQYDSLYRIRQVLNSSIYGSINYCYDRTGNMISKIANLKESDISMNPGKMISGGFKGTWYRNGRNPDDMPGPHAITELENSSKFITYDNNGNMISKNDITYQWDCNDRLIEVINGDISAKYFYDYKGSRKKKQIFNSKDKLNIFYIDKFSEIRHGELLKYVYLGKHRLVRSDKDKNKIFYFYDHLGSTFLVTSDSGKILEQKAYYPFGKRRFDINGNYSYYNFTGKELDIESGLHYFEARYYDSELGKFISVDPLGENMPKDWLYNKQDFNLYAYVGNNPINQIDPLGLFTFGIDLSCSAGMGLMNVGVSAARSVVYQYSGVKFSTGLSLVFDTNLNVGIIEHNGKGGCLGATIGGSFNLQFTNAPTIFHLPGNSTSIEASLGIYRFLGISSEFVIMDNGYYGINIGGNLGFGTPVELHHISENSKLKASFNISDVANYLIKSTKMEQAETINSFFNNISLNFSNQFKPFFK